MIPTLPGPDLSEWVSVPAILPTGPSNPLLALLIDDSDDDAYFLERLMRKSGENWKPSRVRGGDGAIRQLESILSPSASSPRPDVIFLDLKLPSYSGFEILQWILDRNPEPALHVVVLSGSEVEKDMARCKTLGAAGYLVKPVTAAQLTQIASELRGAPGGCRL